MLFHICLQYNLCLDPVPMRLKSWLNFEKHCWFITWLKINILWDQGPINTITNRNKHILAVVIEVREYILFRGLLCWKFTLPVILRSCISLVSNISRREAIDQETLDPNFHIFIIIITLITWTCLWLHLILHIVISDSCIFNSKN